MTKKSTATYWHLVRELLYSGTQSTQSPWDSVSQIDKKFPYTYLNTKPPTLLLIPLKSLQIQVSDFLNSCFLLFDYLFSAFIIVGYNTSRGGGVKIV